MKSVVPLTEAQEGLWFAQRIDPANPVFNTGLYVDIEGPLDRRAFADAVRQAMSEAEALAVRVDDTGAAPMLVIDALWRSELCVVDLRDQPDPPRAAMEAIARDMATPIDPVTAPLVAQWLLATGDARHLWYQRVHHLVIDGFGTSLLTRRIADLYAASVTGAQPRTSPFAPYAPVLAADAEYRTSTKRSADREFWLREFVDRPIVATLAPGPAITARTYRRLGVDLPAGTGPAVHALAEAAGAPWPDVLVAIVGAYLRRHAPGADVVLGVPTMERLGTPAARLPAMVMNVLPLRVAVDEDAALADVVKDVSRRLRQARRHGRYRSEQLRRDLGLVGGERRVYGPLVNILPFDEAPVFPGASAALHVLGTGPVDDLTVTFRADAAGSGLRLEIDANPDLYSTDDVASHAARLSVFLDRALPADRLAAVPTLTPAEAALLDRINDTAHAVDDTTLTALIERTMAGMPDAAALVFGGQTLTYAELDRRTRAFVRDLRAAGVGRGDVVAVALPRSAELIVALFAVLRAGAAYLPIDIDHPRDRIAATLASAEPRVVVIRRADAHRFGERQRLIAIDDTPTGDPLSGQGGLRRVRGPADAPSPADAAYVIYTSGSTGAPKGVVVEHRAIVNRLEWMRTHYAFTTTDRILQKTPTTFDVSVWELFLPAVAGATLVIAPPDAHKDPAWIARLIRDERITTAHFVPSMLAVFLEEPTAAGLSLRRVFCSGEALPSSLRDRFHQVVDAELHNLYGPTEAAVDVTYWHASRADRSTVVPIGFPVWNTRMHVLDERLRRVPPGVGGDLYIAGVQLAREYLGRPDLTAERFIPDPFGQPGSRMYRTGDLALRREDGAIVFLGRSDHQVKIRGLRVELGEIEAAAIASGQVAATAVLAREDRPGDQRIVAYVVPRLDGAIDLDILRASIAARVPDYMVPSAFVVLPDLPLSSSGKLDRKALPAPSATAAPRGREPATRTERRLAAIFAEVLGIVASGAAAAQPIGADDDFFDLGGHSLLAAQVMQRVREEWTCDLGIGALFAAPSVARLAGRIDAALAVTASAIGADTAAAGSRGGGISSVGDGLGALVLVAGHDTRSSAPLFCVHPAGGISWCYAAIGRALDPPRPVFGVQARGLDPHATLPATFAEMARDYVAAIRGEQPEGPYHLAGWSVGGIIAQAMAVELRAAGAAVGLLAMLDAYPSDRWRNEAEPDESAALRALLLIAGLDPDRFNDGVSAQTATGLTRARVVGFLRESRHPLGMLPDVALDGVVRTVAHNNRLVRRHHHRHFDGPLVFFRAGLDHVGLDLSPDEWRPYVSGLDVHVVPSLHAHMTGADAVAHIAPVLEQVDAMKGIDGRLAIVTGAAGGIGAAVVRRLIDAGARVVALDVDAEGLATLIGSLPGGASSRIWSQMLDVRDAGAVDAAIEGVEREHGPIDLCVNVAGVLGATTVVDTDDTSFRRMFEVNTFGVFHVLRALARRMTPRRHGSLVTVSSNAAGIPRHGMAAYAASKAAASMLTRCLGLELAPLGIRCNNVAPGSTRTPMLSSMLPATATPDDVVAGSAATFKTGIPLGKIAEPDDVAGAVLFLLSDEAGHITMADLYVDGGATLRA